MSKPDERLLEEIGRALRDMFESEASRNSTDLPLRAEAFPYWKKRAQELLELRILVPRAEADAAVAVAYEQAVMVADKEARRVGDHIPYFPEAGLSGTVDSLKSVANAIRSLTPQSALDALRDAKAQAVDAAFDRLWKLMLDGWELGKAIEKVKEQYDATA